MRERFVEHIGVPAVVAIAAAVVVLYAAWGAYLLEHAGLAAQERAAVAAK